MTEQNETLDRLDRMIEIAELEHQAVTLHSGDGNRQFEATKGAIAALRNLKETLALEEDTTLQEVEAHVVRNIVRGKLFDVLTFSKSRGIKWLYIGDKQDLETGATVHFRVRNLAKT